MEEPEGLRLHSDVPNNTNNVRDVKKIKYHKIKI